MVTTSLEISKQLKEEGYPQEAEYYYWFMEGEYQKLMPASWCLDERRQNDERYVFYASPTADELLERLPYGNIVFRRHNGKYITCEHPSRQRSTKKGYVYTDKHFGSYDSAADALAKLWIYLKQHNLIDSQ
jgi:hypothetical protein